MLRVILILVVAMLSIEVTAQSEVNTLPDLQVITANNVAQLTEIGNPAFQFDEVGVRAVAFSHDKTLLFVGRWFRNHIILSLDSPEPIVEFEDGIPICDAVFSPDDSFIVLRGFNGISVYDIVNDEIVITSSTTPDELYQRNCVSVTHHELLLAYTDNGIVHLWDSEESASPISLDIVGDKLLFSPDGQYLAISRLDYAIEVWDVETLEQLFILNGHDSAVHNLIFTADSSQLISTDIADLSGRATLIVWDVGTGQIEHQLQRSLTEDHIDNLVLSNNEALVAFSGAWEITIWDVETWKLVKEFPNSTRPTKIAFNQDDSVLFITTLGSTVEAWDLEQDEVHSLRFFDYQSGCWINDLDIDSEGRLIVVGDECGNVRLLGVYE